MEKKSWTLEKKYPLNYASKLALFPTYCMYCSVGTVAGVPIVLCSAPSVITTFKPIFCFVAPLWLYFITRPIYMLYAANEYRLLRCLSLSALNFLSQLCCKNESAFFRQHDRNVCIGKMPLGSTITMSHMWQENFACIKKESYCCNRQQ